ncbi:hypothetical protein RFI_39679, partial [Reticulomyxa filosa]
NYSVQKLNSFIRNIVQPLFVYQTFKSRAKPSLNCYTVVYVYIDGKPKKIHGICMEFAEEWIEFADKKMAKLVARILNGTKNGKGTSVEYEIFKRVQMASFVIKKSQYTFGHMVPSERTQKGIIDMSQEVQNKDLELFMPSNGKEGSGAVAADDVIAPDDKHKSPMSN